MKHLTISRANEYPKKDIKVGQTSLLHQKNKIN